MTSSAKTLATEHSASCFLNSLLREWNGYRVAREGDRTEIRIPLEDDASLVLGLRRFSRLGRHRYDSFELRRASGDAAKLDFARVVDVLSRHLATSFGTSPEALRLFTGRVAESLATIERTLERRGDEWSSDRAPDWNFLAAEQGLVIGHNFHPTPKSRDEFDEADMRAYSPEFAGAFRMAWYSVDPAILFESKARSFADSDWCLELARADGLAEPVLDEARRAGRPLVPFHPWQAAALRRHPVVGRYLEEGRFRRVGQSVRDWHPTSSLRSVYREDAPFMLKFSMSVKLTNSIRHLLSREVERGLQLCDVLATPLGRRFLSEHPGFRVVSEPAYFALKDDEGHALDETIVVCRENPFRGEAARGKAVLATLAQDAPLGGPSPLGRLLESSRPDLAPPARARAWFDAYLREVVRPLVLAHTRYGIVLGAHQQNLVLDLRDGFPVGAYFRDCQGTGYTELGFANFASSVPSIRRSNGNVVSERMGNGLFLYYLVLNSSFNVLTSLVEWSGLEEEVFLRDFRDFLAGLPRDGDEACLRALREGETLLHKGNFLCAFRSLNENTTTDPLAIYTPVDNPLREGACPHV